MAEERRPATIAAQALRLLDEATGAVIPPIHPATTFACGPGYEYAAPRVYGRDSGPTIDHAETVIAALDGGAEALLFASGLAATTAVFETVETGGRIAAPRVMYHGAQDWLMRLQAKRGIGVDFFDAAAPDGLCAALRPGETRIVWIESATNPTWNVIDIAAAAEAAHDAGAILAVDATATPPCTTRALDLGADIVFHSATKYLNGHSDVLGGALVTREANALWEEIRFVRKHVGGVAAPFEAWLLIRGMRTLFLRFERSSANALALARHFEGHHRLSAVLYPGLESHPGHAIAKRQMTGGFGGMLSIRVEGGLEATRRVAGGTEVFIPATSLGGVESLIEHRKSVEGPHSVVPDDLIRISVGIEAVEDLIADLERALARA